MQLKQLKMMFFGLPFAVFLAACAGVPADLEEARILLASGNTDDAITALGIVEPMKDMTVLGNEYLEANRIYAGAKMILAGFDPIRTLSALFFSDSGNELSQLTLAFGDLTADAEIQLGDAKTQLDSVFASAPFSNASDRVKNGLRFQAGFVQLLETLRVAIDVSGLVDPGTIDSAACQGNVLASQVTSADTNLTGSRSNFIASGLEDGNEMVEFVDTLRSSFGFDVAVDIVAFCDFIAGQS